MRALGMPNAHFSLRCGTSAAEIPASAAGWKRQFAGFTPQPVQEGAVGAPGLTSGAQRFASWSAGTGVAVAGVVAGGAWADAMEQKAAFVASRQAAATSERVRIFILCLPPANPN